MNAFYYENRYALLLKKQYIKYSIEPSFEHLTNCYHTIDFNKSEYWI
ncbi:MAG: hypothetical protein FD181_1419 [Prolixibacteraceae bacterium]|nr:MAG: hypothetical protein FD181_1419 [Prolixibacteraceae bacterium]